MAKKKNRRISSLQQEIDYLNVRIRSDTRRRRQLTEQLEFSLRDRELRNHDDSNAQCRCGWCVYSRNYVGVKQWP